MSVLGNIANEIGRIQNAKGEIANAIAAKGVEVPPGAKLDQYPGFINLLSGSAGAGGSVPQGTVIGAFGGSYLNDLFSGDSTLVYADINAAYGVTNMVRAFNGCLNLVNAPAIPGTVTNMSYAFNGCSNLVNAPVIPNNVTNMSSTFYGCSNLVNAPVIPNGVTNMYDAFSNCSSLVNAPAIPDSVTYLRCAFGNCPNLVNAPVIPNSVTDIAGAFCLCSNLVDAPAIPDSVTDMSTTFYRCSNLVNAPVIPNGVTNMYSTFSGCSSLVYAPAIPDSVTKLYYTFNGCSNLSNAPVIPNSLTDMAGTFNRCSSLVNAPVIPDNVVNMYSTFNGCSSLTGDIQIMSRYVNNCTGCFNGTSLPKTVYTRGTTFSTLNAVYGAGINGVNLVRLYDWKQYEPGGAYVDGGFVYDTDTAYKNITASSKVYNSSNASSQRNANSTVYWSSAINVNPVTRTFVLENSLSVSYTNYTNLQSLRGEYFAMNNSPTTLYYANFSAGISRSSASGYYRSYINIAKTYTNPSGTVGHYTSAYIGDISSTDPAAYPAAGEQDGYLYVSQEIE